MKTFWIAQIVSPLVVILTLNAQTAKNVTTTGGTVNVVPKYSGSNSIINSAIFESGGKVGIGTTSPSSVLTVKGVVQSTSGGFRFPDSTVQTSAGLTVVTHDATLSGSGKSSSPLKIAVPLSLSGTTGSTILNVNAGINGGTAVLASSIGGGATVSASSTYDDAISGSSIRAAGVSGISSGTMSIGVYGEATNLPSFAGYFNGNVSVNGTLTKSGGSFKIDDPVDPANKYLSHSFVESPDMMNIYNGNIVTDGTGSATVTLPDWFEALNRDFRYQLTVVGQFAQAIVASKVSGNQFSIRTDKPNVEVSWQVTGVRQDAWANAHRIPVEEEKPDNERDFYLNPELFNQPAEKSVEWVRYPQMMKRHAQERTKLTEQAAQQ